jgi:ribosomal protein L13E
MSAAGEEEKTDSGGLNGDLNGCGNVPHYLQMAISSLHEKLPLMERHLSEISELREKLVKQEQEMSEVISESKVVLSLITKQCGGEASLGIPSSNEFAGEEEMKFGAENLQSSRGKDSVIFSQSISIPLVADLTIKELKETWLQRQVCAKNVLTHVKNEQDCLCEEIANSERDLKLLESTIEERKASLSIYAIKQIALTEQISTLETELAALGDKYCELNQALLNQSPEASNLVLQSLRDDPNTIELLSTSSSPLLRKYVGVVSELSVIVSDMNSLCVQISELGVESLHREELELKKKLRSNREAIDRLVIEEERAMKDLSDCESEYIESNLQGDLIAAMKWGQSTSGGLYSPNVSTASLILLLFQQHCRQQIPWNSLKKCPLCEVVTADQLKRYGCSGFGLKAAGYSAVEARRAGYSVSELSIGVRSVYSAEELLEAGYSVEEMKTGGISAKDFKALGYTIAQLKERGYTVQELRQAGYEIRQIRGAGFSLEELKDGGVTVHEFRSVGFTTVQLKQLQYSVRELSEGQANIGFLRCDFVQEISEAGYSLQEMREGGISANELHVLGYSASQLKEVGYTVSELLQGRRGYSVHQIKAAGYTLREMKVGDVSVPELKSLGFTAAQMHACGYSVRA